MPEPFQAPPGEPTAPLAPYGGPPPPYEVPTGYGAFGTAPRRARGRIVLALLAASALTALVSVVVVVLPLARDAQRQADDALAAFEAAPSPTLPARPVDGPDRVPLPLEDAPALAAPVDGRYALDGFVRFDGEPRLEGSPVDGWAAAAGDPARWTRGGCRASQSADEVVTFDVPDATTSDRTWTEDSIGMTAFFLEDDVDVITPRGEAVVVTVPTSDGNRLDALAQVYDITDAELGGAVEMVYAARALTWHDVTFSVMLVCPAGEVADPVATMQQVLDGYQLVLP